MATDWMWGMSERKELKTVSRFYALISRRTYNGPTKRNKGKKWVWAQGEDYEFHTRQVEFEMPTRTFKTG